MADKRISSVSNKAKKIIRSEMLSYFNPKEYGVRSRLDAMRRDADAGNGGYPKYNDVKKPRKVSDYEKGAHLVDSACLAIYDQDRMLSKIYGKNNVSKWSIEKRHNTYRHLIGREYSSMIEERKKVKKDSQSVIKLKK